VDYQRWADLWNETALECGLPTVIEPSKWSDRRKKALTARLKELGEDAVEQLLTEPLQSAFLRGEVGRDSWHGATFDWLLRPSNAPKVLEGQYRDGSRAKKTTSRATAVHTAVTAGRHQDTGNWQWGYTREDWAEYHDHERWEDYTDHCEELYGWGGERGTWPAFADWLTGHRANRATGSPETAPDGRESASEPKGRGRGRGNGSASSQAPVRAKNPGPEPGAATKGRKGGRVSPP